MDFEWLPAVALVGVPAVVTMIVIAVIPKHRLNEIREDIEEDLI